MRTVTGLIIWLVSALFVIYAFCLNTAAAVFAGAVETSLHLSSVQAAYAVGAFTIGFALMQIPAGYLLDRFNTKIILSAGVLMMAIGSLLISHANGLLLFSIANLIQGMGGSFAFIGTGILISKWFAPRIFPILFGLTQTLSCVLTGAIHYIFKNALLTHSWNILYRDLSMFGFALFIATALIVKAPKTLEKPATVSLGKALSTVFSSPQIWLCAVAAATTFGTLLAYGGFWYLNVQNYYAVSMSSSLILSAVIFIGIGIGTPMLGWISNLIRSRKAVISITLALGNMVLLMGLYLPHFNLPGYILIDTISFLIGFLLSGSMLFYTVVSEISNDQTRGVALSFTNTGVFLFNTALLFIPNFFMTASQNNVFFTYLWRSFYCSSVFYFFTRSLFYF